VGIHGIFGSSELDVWSWLFLLVCFNSAFGIVLVSFLYRGFSVVGYRYNGGKSTVYQG
jgi:hypothetical protein